MKKQIKTVIAIIMMFCLASCTTLRPYERVYVDDFYMKMGANSGEAFEFYVESIREGGGSAGSGKSGGGCGCN